MDKKCACLQPRTSRRVEIHTRGRAFPLRLRYERATILSVRLAPRLVTGSSPRSLEYRQNSIFDVAVAAKCRDYPEWTSRFHARSRLRDPRLVENAPISIRDLDTLTADRFFASFFSFRLHIQLLSVTRNRSTFKSGSQSVSRRAITPNESSVSSLPFSLRFLLVFFSQVSCFGVVYPST